MTTTDTLPITRAVFDDADLEALRAPLASGWVVQGPHVAGFESAFASWTGAGHAIATTSCTTALHLALATLGVGSGDEVLVPAFTWVSTANVVEHLGARPVFVDVSLETFNVTAEALAAAYTPRTVGVLPVHLFGHPADMPAILAFAAARGLWVVEDAACGFDAWIDGRHVGTFGDFGAFSFHPRKSITTGEGGMLLTADGERAALARTLRDHGASRSDFDRHRDTHSFLLATYRHCGFNYRMTDLQGALGETQLAKAPALMASRREVAAWYDMRLAGCPWLRTPARDPRIRHGQQAYVCTFAPERPTIANADALTTRRNAVMATLEQQGIMTRPGTHAAAHLPFYAERYGIRPEDFPNAWIAERCSMALPLFPGMTTRDVERVVDALDAAMSVARAA